MKQQKFHNRHLTIILASLSILLYFIVATALVPNVGFEFGWMSDPNQTVSLATSTIFRTPLSYMGIKSIIPDHPVNEYLQQGDVVTSVNGVPPHGGGNWRSTFRPAARVFSYTVNRGDRTLEIDNAPIAPSTFSWFIDHILLGLIALPAWLVGAVLVYYGNRRQRDAFPVGYTLIAASISLAAFGAQRYDVALSWLGAVPILPVLAVGIAQTALLPKQNKVTERERRVFSAAYSVAFLFSVAALVDIIFLHPQGRTMKVLGIWIYYWCLLWLAGGLLSNPIILAVRAFHLPPSYQRNQVAILLVFTATAILPFVLLTFLPDILFDVKILPSELTVLLLALIPLGYGYVVFRWRYLGLDVLVTRTFPMLLLGLAFVTIYSVLFISLASSVKLTSAASSIFLFGAVLLAPWMGKPFGDFVQMLVYGSDPPDQRTLNTLTDSLVDSSELGNLRNVLDSLSTSIGISRAALLIRNKQAQWFILGAEGNQPIDLHTPTVAASSRSDFVIRNDEADSVYSEIFVRYLWSEAILPMRVRERYLGVLLLGAPVPDGRYNARQVDVLRQFARVLAVTIETMLLYESTRDMAMEMLGVRDAERTKLAMIIHDGPVQDLTLLAARVPANHPGIVEGIRAISNQLREMMTGLHSPILRQSLPRAIRMVSKDFQSEHNIEVRVRSNVSDTIDVPIGTSNAFYQVLKESLHNVLKHADATTVMVDFSYADNELRLKVSDNGRNGAIPKTDSLEELIRDRQFGLVGMYQRAALIGGKWWLESNAQGGVTVMMTAPLRSGADGRRLGVN